MDHSRYDKRRYPIVDVREGYGEWAIADVTSTGLPAETYDLCVQSLEEGLVDEAWLRKKPKWEGRGYVGLPISFAMVWQQKYQPRP